MSAEWDCIPLRELCDFHNGLWTGKNGPFATAHVIRNTNFTADGRIDLSDVAVLQVEAKQFAKRRLHKGDIIIEKSGGGPKQPVGRVVLFELESEGYSFSNFTSAIRVKHPRTLDSTYLHRVLYWWYVSGLTEPLQRRSTGIRNLDFDAYKNLEVPIPSLDEQKRIVAALDQAFAALAKAEANSALNLKDAELLYEESVDDKFQCGRADWQCGTVQSLVGDVSTGPFGSLLHKRDYVEGGTPIINPSNIVAGTIKPDWRKTVSAQGANRLEAYKLRSGDLVVGRRGEMGRCAPVRPEMDGWLCGTGSFFIRPNQDVSIDFVGHLMRSRVMVDRLSALANGATMPNLSNRALAAMPFELPEKPQQIRMLAELKQLREKTVSLGAEFRAKLVEIAALRQSLLQTAFSGQLT